MQPTVSFFIAAFHCAPTRVTVILVLAGSAGVVSGGWSFSLSLLLLSMLLLLP